MKNYKILLISTAVNDLNELLDKLSQFPPKVALKQYDKIIDKMNTLKEFPEMCEIYKITVMGYKFRKMVIDNYLVFYIIKNEIVEIHRIINSRMNIGKIIE